MEPLLNVVREAGQAALGLFTLPYFYIAVLFVWWHARQGTILQRKLFHVRLYGSLQLVLTRVLAGLAVGAVLSIASLGAGAQLTNGTLLCVWIAMAVLALFQLRYVCLAYAAGLLGVLQAVVQWTGADGAQGVLADAVRLILEVHVPSLLFLAGILHIAEGLLVRLQGSKLAIPLFVEGKRGKPVGAYALTGMWPIPLLWLIPAGAEGLSLPWTPLFGMAQDTAGWSLLAFPVLIGFSDRTLSFTPEQKARMSGNSLMIYGLGIAALAMGGNYLPWLSVVGAIAAFVLHEGLLLVSRSRESGREFLYAQDRSGVRVLAVLPGTPAEEMEFQSGEIIKRANGSAVRNKEELHAALQKQAAFCKLEVVNRDGQIRFAQRARYAGEHHQLGLILAPDEQVDYVVGARSGSIWKILREAGARRRGERPAITARREAESAAAELAAGSESPSELDPSAFEPAQAPVLPPRNAASRKKS
ncbi:PDZ domain-containing protein [Cohnella kolymensis]|uniref:PDZ domain-containing protein n=1 Tax=Cohnella kolymensis TaxID=1590652 RepID=UPI000AC4D1EC|nr:PDZ domain-containing protein [Cohnella kolymensis]